MAVAFRVVLLISFLQLLTLGYGISSKRSHKEARGLSANQRSARQVADDSPPVVKPEREPESRNNNNKAAARDAETKLRSDLFKEYNDEIFPGAPTELEIHNSINCVSFDEKTSILTTNGWERYKWNDERLKWNPSEYNGIETLNVATYRIWTPDVTLYNAAESVDRSWTNVILSSNGDVIWVPPATYKSYCRTDEENNTYCRLKFGSWTYNGSQLPLSNSSTADADLYDSDCPYIISGPTAEVSAVEYECCEEPYYDLTVGFYISKFE